MSLCFNSFCFSHLTVCVYASHHCPLIVFVSSGMTERHLQYELLVVTSDVKGAGTDAKVSIEICGSRQTSAMFVLNELAYEGSILNRRGHDTFHVCFLSHAVLAAGMRMHTKSEAGVESRFGRASESECVPQPAD